MRARRRVRRPISHLALSLEAVMDYAKAITFIFQDDNWIGTLLIGGGVTLLGFFFFWTLIGPFLAYALLTGYMMQLIRDVYKDPDAELPPWEDWGAKMADGLKLMVAQFIWELPLFLVMIPFLGAMILSTIYPDSDVLAVFAIVSYFGFLCLTFFYSMFFMIVQPAMTINLTIHDAFARAFDFTGIFRIIKTHLAEVLIIALLVYGISYFAGIMGMVMLLIGVVFTSFWVMLVRGHLYGQLARLAFPATNQETDLATTSQPTTNA
ncbi:MAG TPA: DUF4013 domain-containing protein [Caldilineales bacterium]|nr:DUF4013 domain-containing protein [Caldilineales bacterium]